MTNIYFESVLMAWSSIISNKMRDFDYQSLKIKLQTATDSKDFNLYNFLHENYFK